MGLFLFFDLWRRQTGAERPLEEVCDPLLEFRDICPECGSAGERQCCRLSFIRAAQETIFMIKSAMKANARPIDVPQRIFFRIRMQIRLVEFRRFVSRAVSSVAIDRGYGDGNPFVPKKAFFLYFWARTADRDFQAGST